MGRRMLSFAALLAALGGIAVLVALSAKSPGTAGFWGADASEKPKEPEVVLRGVDMREMRREGAQFRFLSDQASYKLLSGNISATGVTLELPAASGLIIVRSPRADWDMKAGQVRLPEGGSAENAAGWSAEVADAGISLADRKLTSSGSARLSGPGLSVAGNNLVWKWREGKLSLELPKTWIAPARQLRKKG